MTQEDKKVLMVDLCARLPYSVKCHINGDETNTPRILSRIEVDELDGILLNFWTDREDFLSIQVYLSEVKPYLRPMLSMNEEELREYNYLYAEREDNNEWDDIKQYYSLIDWLNAHHFDYRGLIEKGLALEAPKGMYSK